MKSLLIPLFTLAIVMPALGQEYDQDWLLRYYQDPKPEKLVEQVRASARQGLLKDDKAGPLFVGFLSQVMAQNPKEIARWLLELHSLDEEQRSTVVTAAWYSDTEEARACFKDPALKDSAFLQKPPKILELELDRPQVLDLLWGSFMATGDVKNIRRLVESLSLCEHLGAAERFKTSAKTEEDNEKAVLELTFNSALWSLQANCGQHPKVLEYCERIYGDGTLPKDQGVWLGVVLSKVKPDTYHVEIKEGSMKVTRTPPATK